jgi:hypothetical protein
MKHQEYFLILIGLCLITIHGLFPTLFLIDAITIGLFFIISIPVLAYFLKKAKIFGAEFEFKDEINAAEKLVDLSIKNANETKKANKSPHPSKFSVFNLTYVKELIESDRTLALAALRIEIENKLRLAANQLGFPSKKNFTFLTLLQFFTDKSVFRPEQIEAIKKIQHMCTQAIHGIEVSQEDAEKIIGLAEKLNKSFSVGYSIDFNPNVNFEEQGLFCEWEHCIEHFQLQDISNEKSCPVFGHDCPGGPERVKKCGKTIDDIPENRFVKLKPTKRPVYLKRKKNFKSDE